MPDTKNELDKNTFGDSKADSILAKKLSQECNKNLTSYVSRNLLSLTKKLKQISKIDLTERDSFYEMVRKSFISNSKNNHWVEKYPYVLSYFTNCGVKRIRNHKKGLLAQLAEHDPYKVKVDGSIPSQPTIAQAIARAEERDRVYKRYTTAVLKPSLYIRGFEIINGKPSSDIDFISWFRIEVLENLAPKESKEGK